MEGSYSVELGMIEVRELLRPFDGPSSSENLTYFTIEAGTCKSYLSRPGEGILKS